MDPTNMTAMQWIMIGGALGLVFGLVPLITGIIKKNIQFGIYGLLGSIAGGAVLGLLLAVPIAAVFTWLIVRGPKKPVEVEERDDR